MHNSMTSPVLVRDRKTGKFVTASQGRRQASESVLSEDITQAKRFERAEVEWLERMGGFELVEASK